MFSMSKYKLLNNKIAFVYLGFTKYFRLINKHI